MDGHSTGNYIGQSSDRLKFTNVVSSSGDNNKLQKYRNWASIVDNASRSQRRETGKSFLKEDFPRDSQPIERMISYIEPMFNCIREQHKVMVSLNEEFFQLQEGAGKKKKNLSSWMLLCNQLPNSPMWENKAGQSIQDWSYHMKDSIDQSRKKAEEFIKQTSDCVISLENGGEGLLEDWPNIQAAISKVMERIEDNGQTIHSMRSELGIQKLKKIDDQITELNLKEADLLRECQLSTAVGQAEARWESMRRLAESLMKACEVWGKPS